MKEILAIDIDTYSKDQNEIFEHYKALDGNRLSTLHPISNINLFVGSNNSGKSRFLRALFTQKEYPQFLGKCDLSERNQIIDKNLSEIHETVSAKGATSINSVSLDKIEEIRKSLPSRLRIDEHPYIGLDQVIQKIEQIDHIKEYVGMLERNDPTPRAFPSNKIDGFHISRNIVNIKSTLSSLPTFHHISSAVRRVYEAAPSGIPVRSRIFYVFEPILRAVNIPG